MSVRTEKIGSQIQRVLSSHISNIASEKKLGFLSVSSVNVTKDISIAKVFLNFLIPNKDLTLEKINEMLAVINDNKGYLRSIVAHELQLRTTPELRFFYDDTLEQMENVNKLIDSVKKNSPYREEYGDDSVYKKDK